MFFLLHILFVATAAAGMITGVSAAIFFRKNKNWLKIHKTFNSFSLAGIAAGIIMVFIYIASTGGKHIDGLHQMTGLTAFMIAFISLWLGFYQFKAKNKLAAGTAHRWLGRLSLLLVLTAITLGLRLVSII